MGRTDSETKEYTNRVLDTTNAYICNSRPRRFGKSYAANMLAAYYSKGAASEKMFSELQIGKSTDFRKHLNRYDVIHIDIQWFLANCSNADNKEKTQSALNNFDEFTMLSASSLAPYIGFTEDEVRTLAERYHQDFSKVKSWYDGYLLSKMTR